MWPLAKMVHFSQAPMEGANFFASAICTLSVALFKKLGSKAPGKGILREH